MDNFYHKVTAEELEKFPTLFPEGTIEGELHALTPRQYEVLGLELHTLNEGDMVTNPQYAQLGLHAGDVIEREIPTINISEEDETLGE